MPQSEEKHEPGRVEEGLGNKDKKQEYPGLRITLPIVGAVCLAIFLSALDRTIIGVAVPQISSTFKAYSDVAWYESAYLLTSATFQLPMGKIYTFFPVKWTFIITVAIFLVGSIVIAAAPTSAAFITGRAITGIASAGLMTGAQLIFTNLLPLEKRPKYQGFLGGTFGIASIAGPLLGGVFTSHVTWRWCFWINLPIGGTAVLVLLLILPNDPAPKSIRNQSLSKIIPLFDPVGSVLSLSGLTLLLLALQWGGNEHPWKSTQVLVTLILGVVLLLAFGISQLFIGENATIPPRIARNRSIAATAGLNLCFGATLIVITFYLPQWYQVVHGLSAAEAGVRMLVYFLTTVICVIISGALVSKLGYYTPWMLSGTALLTVGCGLLTTITATDGTSKVMGFQAVVGAGMGLTLAQGFNAAQTVLNREDIASGVTLLAFANFLGGTLFVSVCQDILSNTLTSELRETIPGLDVKSILKAGVGGLDGSVSQDQLPMLRAAYNEGIRNVYYCALALSIMAFVSSLFVEWKTVKKLDEEVDEEVDGESRATIRG